LALLKTLYQFDGFIYKQKKKEKAMNLNQKIDKKNYKIKISTLFVTFFVLIGFMFTACSPLASQYAEDLAASRAIISSSMELTGANGTLVVSAMENTNLTISYTPSTAVDLARLYVTPGDGTGLVLAAQTMNQSNGTWTYSFSHPSFTEGAKISLDVLTVASGIEINVPQGTLADSNTWVSFIFGSTVEGIKVSFDSQDATVAASPASKMVVEPATTIDSLPVAPTKNGFIFKGWFTDVNGGGTAFDASTPVTGDITIYAKWEPNQNSGDLTLTGPNGTIFISDMLDNSLKVSYTPDSSINSARLFLSQGNGTGLVLASQTMTNQGGTYSYTFSHTSFTEGVKIYVDVLQNSNTGELNVPQGTLANTTSWAFFEYGAVINTYQVTFDSENADEEATPSTIDVTSPATTVGDLPSEPLKKGALFGGWYTETEGNGTAFTADTTVSSDITVYASWIIGDTSIVYFDDRGATTEVDPQSKLVVTGQSLSTLPAAPAKTGNTFTGWNLESDGSGADFTENSIVEDDIIVYAQWIDNGMLDDLIALQPGMHMTMQFNNKTNGAFSDDQVYLTMLARNEAQDWCWVKADGTLQPMSPADNGQLVKNGRQCANYSLLLSDMEGFQLPSYVSSGRVFVSLGSPIYLTVNIDGNGKVAYAAPDLNNETDPNRDVYFDWYEFAIVDAWWAAGSPVGFWGNTTQVDQLSIPLMARVYEKNSTDQGTLIGHNGISTSREDLWAEWEGSVPSEFSELIGPYRINAPCKDPDGFGLTSPNAAYYDSYVNEIWNQYRNEDLTYQMYWDGATYQYTGRVMGDAFVFSRSGRQNFVAVASKPNATEIFEASGVLATGNTEEGAIQARIAAAFNRHVMEDTSLWDTPSAFYQEGPANFYSKFMHDHAYNGGAYGFAYDDVGDFSGALWSYNGRAVVIDINW
jgi:uncharacterized repeat protein (TIGR02543 family)